MKKILAIAVAILAMAFSASAAEYSVDENSIDTLIENAVEVSDLSSFELIGVASESNSTQGASLSETKQIASILLCFFIGGFGVHRMYLKSTRWMWAAYTFTFGGIFGIVPFVDFVVMLVEFCEESDFAQFAGNTHFLMWI